MAEFVYDCTIDEWWTLFEAIFVEHPLRFAVDWWYRVPQCPYYTKLTDEVKQQIFSTRRSVYILGDAFSDRPLYLREQPTGPKAGEFSIDISRGGPAIQMAMPAQFDEGELIWFGAADIWFQKLYWNDTSTQAYPAPKPLKDAFGLIKRTLQRQLLYKKIRNEKRWISPKAWELFEAGKAAFPVWGGKCYTVHGEVPPPMAWRRTPIVQNQVGD